MSNDPSPKINRMFSARYAFLKAAPFTTSEGKALYNAPDVAVFWDNASERDAFINRDIVESLKSFNDDIKTASPPQRRMLQNFIGLKDAYKALMFEENTQDPKVLKPWHLHQMLYTLERMDKEYPKIGQRMRVLGIYRSEDINNINRLAEGDPTGIAGYLYFYKHVQKLKNRDRMEFDENGSFLLEKECERFMNFIDKAYQDCPADADFLTSKLCKYLRDRPKSPIYRHLQAWFQTTHKIWPKISGPAA